VHDGRRVRRAARPAVGGAWLGRRSTVSASGWERAADESSRDALVVVVQARPL
jgi:hypothetical protein